MLLIAEQTYFSPVGLLRYLFEVWIEWVKEYTSSCNCFVHTITASHSVFKNFFSFFRGCK